MMRSSALAALGILLSSCTDYDVVAQPGDISECSPRPELCADRLDNDCDGEVDETRCEPGEFIDLTCRYDAAFPPEASPPIDCVAPPPAPCVDAVALLHCGGSQRIAGRTVGRGNDFAFTSCGGPGIDREDFAVTLVACETAQYVLQPLQGNDGIGVYYVGGDDPCRGIIGGCASGFGCGSTAETPLEAGERVTVVFDGEGNDGIFELIVTCGQ